jgi:hypothetical protein
MVGDSEVIQLAIVRISPGKRRKSPLAGPGKLPALTIAAEVGPSPEFGGCAKVEAGGPPRHDGTAKQDRILARIQRTRRL